MKGFFSLVAAHRFTYEKLKEGRMNKWVNRGSASRMEVVKGDLRAQTGGSKSSS